MTPICASCMVSAVPPALKKGREMPVLGMELVTTAMFRSACHPIWAVRPMTSMHPNLSGARRAMEMPLYTSRMKSRMMTTAPTNPSSSQTMAKMKSFCGSER